MARPRLDIAMVIAVVAAVVMGGGAALGLTLSGGDPKPTPAGAAATWEVITPYPLATSTGLTIAVTRESCAGGHTGTPLTPRVTYEETRVVIVAEVEPLVGNGARTCQGNDSVPVAVQLNQPIGARELVDGACLSDGLERPAAVHDGDCVDPVRWSFR